jgi:predicted ATPase/Tfp pilus assembly protein PilF
MHTVYELGPFRLDAQAGVLTHNGVATPLGARGVAVLAALVSRAGEYVERSVIVEAAWPGVVVEEANLTVQISAIRRVLADAPGGEHWIETLTRRGYRFVGPVSTDAARATHNLPRPLTSFVGREREIAEIKSLFGTTRLLTLTGTGGTGKSRLALEVAADLLASHQDGVWLTELAAIAEPDRVAQTVAMSLGIAEQPGKSLTQTLIDHLASRRLVLLLDNAEHLLGPCAELAYAVLRHCGNVEVLTTSREPLGVEGEQLYRVPPMPVPDPKRDVTPDDIAHYESVRLFVERARLHEPRFAMDVENAAAIASICYRLDGIPLSLELAAARVQSMTIEEIDNGLGQRFRLLTGGSRTSLPRQQTLRSMIDWSTNLLREAEKALLLRCSVFAGGWTAESAGKVCVGAPIGDATAIVKTLGALVEKSLVLADSRSRSTRFRLLETIRQYALEALEENGEGAHWRRRHLEHFAALAEETEPHLTDSDQQEWLDRLEAEHDNARAALAWSLTEGGDLSSGLRLAGSFWRFWHQRGFLNEGRDWLSKLLAASSGMQQTRTEARAKALNGAGTLAKEQGDYAAARAMFEEQLAIWRTLDGRRGIASALNNLGGLTYSQGDYPTARVLFEESLAIRRALGDRVGIAASVRNLGNLAYLEGDYDAARALYEESLGIQRELGNQSGIALSLQNLGLALEEQGDHAAARAAFDEGLAIHRELGNRPGIGNVLNNLGNAACEQGDYLNAQRLYEEALAIQRELGDRERIAAVLDNLALVAAEQGNHVAARSLGKESLAIRWTLDDRRGIAWSLEGLANAVFALKGPIKAARIWGTAARVREEVGCPLPPRDRERSDRRIALARAAMGDDAAFDGAWQDGRAMPLGRAVEYVLDDHAE